MSKEFDGMTTKEIAIKNFKKLEIIEKNTSTLKESLKWNWRLTWLLLTIFTGIGAGTIVFVITASVK